MTNIANRETQYSDRPASSDYGANLAIATKKLEGRHRQILASVSIPCSAEQLWQVLTDYDNLASFIPNLATSRCLSRSEAGTLLEQVGTQCFLNVKVCARVVLNMVEQFPDNLGFTMVEGDFRTFEGAWQLEPGATEGITRLIYSLKVCPPRAIPVQLIERHLRRDLTQNLEAIRQQAIAVASAA